MTTNEREEGEAQRGREYKLLSVIRELSASGHLKLSGSLNIGIVRHADVQTDASIAPPLPQSSDYPEIQIQAAILNLGDTTNEGRLVESVSIAWFEIARQVERDPNFLFQIHWRNLEELIAGAYERDGWPDVVLTSRSADGGRDVIATKPGIGSIRIIDSVKAYKSGHRVTAEETFALLGVLEGDQNVSKGIVTTTSEFAPGIFKDPRLQRLIPYRLELRDGNVLSRWLVELLNAEP